MADAQLPPDEVEARGLAMLAEASAAILTGVAREVPGWVIAQVERVLDAWGRADPETRATAITAARPAGDAAERRVSARLRALLEADPREQRSTPLEIVRTVYEEPTGILIAAGVPPVVRDPFDEAAWPEDRYGLVPRTLGDLGDPDLAPFLLVWGQAKATVLRARAGRSAR